MNIARPTSLALSAIAACLCLFVFLKSGVVAVAPSPAPTRIAAPSRQPIDSSRSYILDNDQIVAARVGGQDQIIADRAHLQTIACESGLICIAIDPMIAGHLTLLAGDSPRALRQINVIDDCRLDQATAIEDARELPDHRLLIHLHVSPQCGLALRVDPVTGDRDIVRQSDDEAAGDVPAPIAVMAARN